MGHMIIEIIGTAIVAFLIGRRTRPQWKHGWYNGGFYHHGAVAREGKMCVHCSSIRWPETDQMFYDKLPEWLKKDPELHVPAHVKR